jgi:hypothetical protein
VIVGGESAPGDDVVDGEHWLEQRVIDGAGELGVGDVCDGE